IPLLKASSQFFVFSRQMRLKNTKWIHCGSHHTLSVRICPTTPFMGGTIFPPHTTGTSPQLSRAPSAPASPALALLPARHNLAINAGPTRATSHTPQLSRPGHCLALLPVGRVSGRSGCRGGLTSATPSSGSSHQDVDVHLDKSGHDPCVKCLDGYGLR